MKAGFKPKLLTKKEWQDSRPIVCKGCGVGEALDQLQGFRNKSIAAMSIDDVYKANAVLAKLTAALQKAEGKCGSLQKDAKAGIGEYKKIVADFEKRLKAIVLVQTSRANELKKQPATLDEVFARIGSDAAYRDALVAFTKTEYTDKTLDAWLLWKQKKFTDMVRKYGPNNDYNISGPINTVLLEVFVGRTAPTPEKLKLASHLLNNGSHPGAPGTGTIGGSFSQMLSTTQQGATGRFHRSDAYKTYVAKKLPIADFKM
jgi:hypothetical protein